MNILLDEKIDARFKNHFPEVNDVFTVRDVSWNGIKNGELLVLLKENSFDAWVVVDKNIPYQQNIFNFHLIVIVLDVYRNTLRNLLPLLPENLNVLSSPQLEKIFILKEKQDTTCGRKFIFNKIKPGNFLSAIRWNRYCRMIKRALLFIPFKRLSLILRKNKAPKREPHLSRLYLYHFFITGENIKSRSLLLRTPVPHCSNVQVCDATAA